MSSKSVGTKRKDVGLETPEPRRKRANTGAMATNARRGAMPETRKRAHGTGSDAEKPKPARRAKGAGAPAAGDRAETEGSLIGRRVGHAVSNVKRAQARPEKTRRDRPVDTAKKGVAADDRKVGAGHTARRNTKLRTSGMTAMLEDSTEDRPSRKSTRRSTNRVKQSTQLTRRTQRAVRSPKARATKASVGAGD